MRPLALLVKVDAADAHSSRSRSQVASSYSPASSSPTSSCGPTRRASTSRSRRRRRSRTSSTARSAVSRSALSSSASGTSSSLSSPSERQAQSLTPARAASQDLVPELLRAAVLPGARRLTQRRHLRPRLLQRWLVLRPHHPEPRRRLCVRPFLATFSSRTSSPALSTTSADPPNRASLSTPFPSQRALQRPSRVLLLRGDHGLPYARHDDRGAPHRARHPLRLLQRRLHLAREPSRRLYVEEPERDRVRRPSSSSWPFSFPERKSSS